MARLILAQVRPDVVIFPHFTWPQPVYIADILFRYFQMLQHTRVQIQNLHIVKQCHWFDLFVVCLCKSLELKSWILRHECEPLSRLDQLTTSHSLEFVRTLRPSSRSCEWMVQCVFLFWVFIRQPVANISKHSLVWPCPDVLSHFKVAFQWRRGNVLAWMRSARSRHEAVSQLSQPNLSLFSFARHGLSSPISSPSHGWF